MLIPRKVKHRKQHHPRQRGIASGGTSVSFGDYGIQALGHAYVLSNWLDYGMDLQEAIDAYRNVVQIAPKNRDAWLDYAETLFEAKQIEDSLEAYRTALLLDPDCAVVYVQQAKVLFALGRTEESIHALKMAFKLDPEKKKEFPKMYPDLYRNSRIRGFLDLDR